jgi:ribosomal protein S18 acetylase RimI-like enzyme
MPTTRRPVTEDDIDFVYALRESAYRARVEQHFGPWLEPQQREFLANDMAETPYQIILENGRAVGSVAVSHHDDHDFVEDIMVHADHRDRGLGTHVMHELMDAAKARGVPLRLSVLDGNRVRVLYERLGFRVTLVVPPRTKFEWP